MHLKASTVPEYASIENIIFDFGGVICDIDFRVTEQQLLKLGFNAGDPAALPRTQQLVADLERGSITPGVFRDGMKQLFIRAVTDKQLDDAWNALILEIPEERIRCLEQVRQHYRIFLLSNTNEIHYNHYVQILKNSYGYNDFEDLFEKAWFSYRLGLIKPDREIFRHAARTVGLDPAKTLFIDDTLKHVKGAEAAGLHGFHLNLETGIRMVDLFES